MPIYVQHEVLGRVSDVFNAEAIWQAPGLALFSVSARGFERAAQFSYDRVARETIAVYNATVSVAK